MDKLTKVEIEYLKLILSSSDKELGKKLSALKIIIAKLIAK